MVNTFLRQNTIKKYVTSLQEEILCNTLFIIIKCLRSFPIFIFCPRKIQILAFCSIIILMLGEFPRKQSIGIQTRGKFISSSSSNLEIKSQLSNFLVIRHKMLGNDKTATQLYSQFSFQNLVQKNLNGLRCVSTYCSVLEQLSKCFCNQQTLARGTALAIIHGTVNTFKLKHMSDHLKNKHFKIHFMIEIAMNQKSEKWFSDKANFLKEGHNSAFLNSMR